MGQQGEPGADPLGTYFRSVQRYSPQLGGREGLRGNVDGILNELQIPASLDADGDWRFQSDVGPMLLIVDKEHGDLVLIQSIEEMQKRHKDRADAMQVLLSLNLESEWARFAAVKDDGKDLLVLTARLPEPKVDRERVEAMLLDAMGLSRRLDELLDKAPVEPAEQGASAAAAAAAGWYPDPRGQSRLRYWDGQAWTEHTAE